MKPEPAASSLTAVSFGRRPARSAILGASALTSDIVAATHRHRDSSLVTEMHRGTLRGFVTHHVWSEISRVLEDRARESGDFDLDAALRLW
ncbi:hypothetical protein GCM10017566_05150 [Amycolatopsis bartoniae]|uniref:Uncharacterized protein n=1 Tax=Amycolatopsis bartoniae TaxID=941986 RepID=A0A8H9M318_9PSEU|nr:hypothetical protein GCM10017566_05150 [Amycolatopsis bartoniae]